MFIYFCGFECECVTRGHFGLDLGYTFKSYTDPGTGMTAKKCMYYKTRRTIT